MANFSERLKLIRKRAGISQEGGTEPTVSDAARIADFFAVSLDYLAGRGDEITPKNT